MRAAVFKGKEDLEVCEVKRPKIRENEVLLKIKAASLCGTDVHIYKGGFPVKVPLILGHEYAGIIEEVGERVKGFKVGERVCGSPIFPCGECWFCQHNQMQLCEKRLSFGVNINGCFAEYMIVPRPEKGLVKMPEEISFEEAALVGDLFSTANRSLKKAEAKEDDTIAVFGAGPIGLTAIMSFKAEGGNRIIAVDVIDYRLQAAKRLGASLTINPLRENTVEKIGEFTKGRGADIIIETACIQKTLNDAIKSVRRGGTISVAGLFESSPEINMLKVVLSEIKILGFLCPIGVDRLHYLIKLLQERKINLQSLITHRFSLNEVNRAITVFDKKLEESIKVMILF